MIKYITSVGLFKTITSLSANFLASKTVWETLWTLLVGFFNDLFMPLLDILASLVLVIYQWVLTLIDFCFVLIKQLGGLNTDFSSFESIAEGDIIFQFLLNETVVNVLKTLGIVAIVVILLFGIIAIIKSEWTAAMDSLGSGDVKNDKGKIWTNIFQSCLLLVLVPVLFIGGFIMSNAILQTLLNTFNVSNNMTIGSEIFMASSYNANAYRIYAEQNKKIPITYSFNQINDYTAVTDWDSSGSISQISQALQEYKRADEWSQGYATFEMFYLQEYFTMSDIDKMQQASMQNDYNAAYDDGIKTYQYEYYVMADLLDYLMKTGEEVCIVSVQNAYATCLEANIQLDIEAKSGGYEFYVDYADGKEAIKYFHKTDSHNEADGSVYLICTKNKYQKAVSANAITYGYYYQPITSKNSRFESGYQEDGEQYIVAKGIFDDGKYPTAIKDQNGKISFYRDKLNVPTFASFLPHISYELPEGSHEVGAVYVIKNAVQTFTGIDVSQYLPYVYFNVDFTCLFTKVSRTVATFESGSFYVDYGFTYKQAEIQYFYQKININFVILILTSALILSNVIKAFFGLIKRSVDIMFLYLVYPAAVSTIPLYGNSSFSKWVQSMARKTLSLYGLMIGINLVLLIIPLGSSIEIFTAADLNQTALSSISNLSAYALNTFFQILFTIVGINFIFSIGPTIQEFVLPKADKGDTSILDNGEKVVKNVSETYKKASEVITGKNLVSDVKKITGYTDPATGQYVAGWIPGSAGINAINHITETGHGYKKNREIRAEESDKNREAMSKAIEDAKSSKKSGK